MKVDLEVYEDIIWVDLEFQGHRSKVKVTRSINIFFSRVCMVSAVIRSHGTLPDTSLILRNTFGTLGNTPKTLGNPPGTLRNTCVTSRSTLTAKSLGLYL